MKSLIFAVPVPMYHQHIDEQQQWDHIAIGEHGDGTNCET